MANHRVLTGIDYPPNKRAEVGDIVSDLPARSIPWLLKNGHIEDADKAPTAAPEATPAPQAGTVENGPEAPAVAATDSNSEVSE